jgi:hypothetical protein
MEVLTINFVPSAHYRRSQDFAKTCFGFHTYLLFYALPYNAVAGCLTGSYYVLWQRRHGASVAMASSSGQFLSGPAIPLDPFVRPCAVSNI